MELAAADTAYEKDRQIKILKDALYDALYFVTATNQHCAMAERIRKSIISSDKIEASWRTEGR